MDGHMSSGIPDAPLSLRVKWLVFLGGLTFNVTVTLVISKWLEH